MPSSEVSAAQVSSGVLRGFEPHNTTAAPAPLRHRASAPVSGVRCSEPAMRIPSRVRLRSNSPRRYESAGILRSDQSMSDLPRSAHSVAIPCSEDDISSPLDLSIRMRGGKQRALLLHLPILPIGGVELLALGDARFRGFSRVRDE